MPASKRRGARTHSSCGLFRNCTLCGISNSVRRWDCRSCGNALKTKNRPKLTSAARKSQITRATMSEIDRLTREESMETSLNSEDQDIGNTAEEASKASSPPPSHQSHASHPPTQSESQSLTTRTHEENTSDFSSTPVEQNITFPSIPPQNTSDDLATLLATSQESHLPQDSHPSQKSHPPQEPRCSQPPAFPDFFSALQMKPAPQSQQARSSDGCEGSGTSEGGASQVTEEVSSHNGTDKSLLERYRKDPESVLELLKSALSLDKLSQLINSEHSSSTEHLKHLQAKLEAAYTTLKECAENKAALNTTIEETNDKIKGKRKHLENLREDLRILGEEEMILKKRRDSTHSRCSQLKQKLKASREALHLIATLENTEHTHTKDTV